MRAVAVDGGGGGGSPLEVEAVKAVSSVVQKVEATAALHLSVQRLRVVAVETATVVVEKAERMAARQRRRRCWRREWECRRGRRRGRRRELR